MQTFFMLFNNSFSLLLVLALFFHSLLFLPSCVESQESEKKTSSSKKLFSFSFIAVVELENQNIHLSLPELKKKTKYSFVVYSRQQRERCKNILKLKHYGE